MQAKNVLRVHQTFHILQVFVQILTQLHISRLNTVKNKIYLMTTAAITSLLVK